MSTKLLSIEGNLGANPVVKLLATGKKVCNFSVAINKEWLDENNNKQKKTDWHNVECWDRDAEFCEKNLSKGVKVFITGTIKLSNWTDKEGVEKFSKTIQAKKIELLSVSTNTSETSLES